MSVTLVLYNINFCLVCEVYSAVLLDVTAQVINFYNRYVPFIESIFAPEKKLYKAWC